MDIPESFKKKVDNDIIELKQIVNDENNILSSELEKLQLYQRLTATYDAYIFDFGMVLKNVRSGHIYAKVTGEALFFNLKAILARLETFRAYGYTNPPSVNEKSIATSSITVSPIFQNTNTNVNKNEITVNVSFNLARKTIEDMPGLTDSDIKEILAKIDEIKAITEAPIHKKTKWEKVKPIIKWLADKSVDVGMVLLPLLLKAQQ